MRFDLVADVHQFFHELLVDVKAAGRVDDQYVAALLLRPLHAVLGYLDRVGVGALVVDRHVELCTEGLQLIDGGGAIDVAGDHRRALALRQEEVGQFAACGGLARTLQAHHHDHRGRPRGEGQLRRSRAHERGQLLVDDLDELLRRGQAAEHFGAQRTLFDLVDELLDDLEVDVGLEQSQPDLARGPLNVFVGEPALPLEAIKCRLQLI